MERSVHEEKQELDFKYDTSLVKKDLEGDEMTVLRNVPEEFDPDHLPSVDGIDTSAKLIGASHVRS